MEVVIVEVGYGFHFCIDMAQLILLSLHVSGTIPESLTQLVHLTELTLRFNNLTGRTQHNTVLVDKDLMKYYLVPTFQGISPRVWGS